MAYNNYNYNRKKTETTDSREAPTSYRKPNDRPCGQFPAWYDYYNPTNLLSMTDINGKRPAVYISAGNRTGGKTTAFNSLLLNRFIKRGEKFGLVYRYAKDGSDIVERFFKDIGKMWFAGHEMTYFTKPFGVEIYFDGKSCGYGLPLNLADDIKKRSHLLSDIQRVLFDEFQSDTDSYLDDEVTKLLSIMFSLSRGGGKLYRYVPLYLISNQVSTLNPYYEQMGVNDRMRQGAKFIKGDGWVMQNWINENSKNAIEASPLARAFSKSKYMAYASSGKYLRDDNTQVGKIKKVKKRYQCTLFHQGIAYGLDLLPNGNWYFRNNGDMTYKKRYAIIQDDVKDGIPLLPEAVRTTISEMRKRGKIYYETLKCKGVLKNV